MVRLWGLLGLNVTARTLMTGVHPVVGQRFNFEPTPSPEVILRFLFLPPTYFSILVSVLIGRSVRIRQSLTFFSSFLALHVFLLLSW